MAVKFPQDPVNLFDTISCPLHYGDIDRVMGLRTHTHPHTSCLCSITYVSSLSGMTFFPVSPDKLQFVLKTLLMSTHQTHPAFLQMEV